MIFFSVVNHPAEVGLVDEDIAVQASVINFNRPNFALLFSHLTIFFLQKYDLKKDDLSPIIESEEVEHPDEATEDVNFNQTTTQPKSTIYKIITLPGRV